MQHFSWQQQTDLQKMFVVKFHTKISEIYTNFEVRFTTRLQKNHWGNENAWHL